MSKTLDSQIKTLGFWSAIVAIVTTVVSFVLPLDVPDGYSAANTDRVVWLVENRNAFVAGWVNQFISMLSLSAVLFCGAWLAGTKNPIRGILAAGFVAMATMAFFIPKFIAAPCGNLIQWLKSNPNWVQISRYCQSLRLRETVIFEHCKVFKGLA